jgi:pyruvate/2-oxoglutarate dehydrogenase complex dihydrolipoamide dehydrogenase (E3) component
MSGEGRPDVCVIGGGAGGLAVATGAAQLGARAVLVEMGKLGGDNLHRGTIPSKALIAAARHLNQIRQAKTFGLSAITPVFSQRAIIEHMQSTIATVAPNESAERLAGLGVRVIRAPAKFEGRDVVAAGDERISAQAFVIATGSSPSIPGLQGIEAVPHLTNETLFQSSARLDPLIVIGGGGVALELAQAYQRLGSRVTVVAPDGFLAEHEPELAQPLLNRLADEGLTLVQGARIERVEPRESGGVRLILEKSGARQALEGSDLLIAAGRSPNIAGLGLEVAGVSHGATGIPVSSGLQTSNPRIFAIGDVTGGPAYANVARHQASIVLRRVLGGERATYNPDIIPFVTCTDPELARIGLGEAEARARHGRRVRVLRWPFSENDRAIAERRTDGYVKVIANANGTILGATILGAGAGELIQSWALAVSSKLSVAQFAESLAAYPTLSETGLRAAQGYTLERSRVPSVGGRLRLLWRSV